MRPWITEGPTTKAKPAMPTRIGIVDVRARPSIELRLIAKRPSIKEQRHADWRRQKMILPGAGYRWGLVPPRRSRIVGDRINSHDRRSDDCAIAAAATAAASLCRCAQAQS